MFNTAHIIYIVVGFFINILGLVLAGIFVKNQKWKDFLLIFFAVVTVAIHFSGAYVSYFTTGVIEVDAPMILPIYPCNVAMWTLLICSRMKNKESEIFKILAEFTFYLGLLGGVVGIVFNEIYANNPTLAQWDILKGLLSHSIMIFGCGYLLVGKYIKINIHNVLSVTIGLIFLLIDGCFIISLYKIFGKNPPNAMFLLEIPFTNIKWLNTFTIGIIGIILVLIVVTIVETFTIPKEERWYKKIKFRGNK